jgi:hypothetical protein
MKNEGERAIPRKRIQVDRLAAANPRCDPGDGDQSRQAADESQNSLGARREEARHQNLEQSAREKRAWSHQYESCRTHAIMLSALPLGLM